jgi:hypothetical protein
MAIIKLDKHDVEMIKHLCCSTQLIDREIAEMFGVSRKHINSIRNKKRWSYEYGKETDKAQEEAITRGLNSL